MADSQVKYSEILILFLFRKEANHSTRSNATILKINIKEVKLLEFENRHY